MSLKEILFIPDKRLRDMCEPLADITEETQSLIDDMLETMYDAPGIGLAAPQIGVKQRLVVIDLSREDGKRDPIVLINPQITAFSDEWSEYDEGCLSIPDFFATVERPAECSVTYLDRDGNSQSIDADGLLSTCLQHEVDHLDGKLFIDHISKLKRDRVLKKFSKMAKTRKSSTE